MTIYERALQFLQDGDVVGLGSGRTSSTFIELLGERVRQGLRIRGVPTSRASEDLAGSLGIPLVSLDEALPLTATIDGADEVDLELNLIKGYGRALVREKVVAAASRRLVILAGLEKAVSALGARGRLPVEVVPFARPLVQTRLREMGMEAEVYVHEGQLFHSDNGNIILDCKVGPIDDPWQLEQRLCHIPGVVGTGLFLGMASVVLIGDESRGYELVEERRRDDDVGDMGP